MIKDEKGKGAKRFLPLFFLLILILLSTLLFRSFSFGLAPVVWDKYYLLLVPKQIEEDIVLNFLEEGGVNDVFSYSDLFLSYSSFDEELNEVLVKDASLLFERGDIRYDIFFQTVRFLFQTDKHHVFYIPDSNSIFSLYRLCNDHELFSKGWKLVDWNPRSLISGPLIFLIYILLLILLVRQKIIPIVVGALPFCYVILIYGFTILPSAILLHFFWWFVGNRLVLAITGKKRDFIRLFTFGVVLSVVSVMFYLHSNESIFSILLINVYMGFLPGLGNTSLLKFEKRLTSPEHKLFEPIFLLGGVSLSRRPQKFVRNVTVFHSGSQKEKRHSIVDFIPLLVLLLAVVVADVDLGTVSYQFPAPAKDLSLKNRTLTTLSQIYNEKKGEVPNFSDYIAHRVFQEFLLYNPEYGIPFKKDVITVSTFISNGGKIVQEDQISINFDKEWLKSFLKRIEKDEIGRFYLSQKFDAPIVYTNSRGSEQELFSIRTLILYFLLSILLLSTLFDVRRGIMILRNFFRERFKRCEN